MESAAVERGADDACIPQRDCERDATRYENPNVFDLRRKAEHQAFGAGGRHFCLGTALARLELKILIEKTLARYPRIRIAGRPRYVESPFANQLKTLPVTLMT